MKIELDNNKVFFENQGSKKEIHPFWLRERVNGETFIDKGTQQRLFDPTDLKGNVKIHSLNLSSFDILITVCDHARDTCPNILDIKTKIHKSFRDPAIFVGSEKEKLLVYRDVRDQINVFCQQLIFQDYNLV